MSSALLRRAVVLTLLAAALPGAVAQASAPKKADDGAHLDLAPIGLPVHTGGKIKNYVFVQTRLVPGPGFDATRLREKEPYYRDALVRSAHRTTLNPAGDWTTLDRARLEATLLTEARRISGPKSVRAVILLNQTPRRRTGLPGSAPR